MEAESLGGPAADETARPVSRQILHLAWPVLLEQSLAFCVSLTDTWLSGAISAEATSAVGLGAYVSWLVTMLVGLLGVGATAVIARHWGAGEHAQANQVLNRCFVAALVLGFCLCATIFAGAPLIGWALNLNESASAVTVRYLRWDAIGHLGSGAAFLTFAALRGAGDMRTPMQILACVNIANLLISATLVFGVGPLPWLGWNRVVIQPWGIDGIVAGTVCARFLGVGLVLLILVRKQHRLWLDTSEIRSADATLLRVLRIGGPSAAEGVLMWSGQFVFLMIVSALGQGDEQTAIFAAHVIGIRVESLTYLPAVAWGAAAATLVGQSLGAQQYRTAIAAGHTAVKQCALLATAMTVVFFIAAPQIYALMHESPAVHAAGIPAFRMIAFFQVPLVFSIVYVHALKGAGETKLPLFLTLVGVYGIRIPLAWLFGVVLAGGLLGAWIGMAADVSLRAACAFWLYRRAQWVHRAV